MKIELHIAEFVTFYSKYLTCNCINTVLDRQIKKPTLDFFIMTKTIVRFPDNEGTNLCFRSLRSLRSLQYANDPDNNSGKRPGASETNLFRVRGGMDRWHTNFRGIG